MGGYILDDRVGGVVPSFVSARGRRSLMLIPPETQKCVAFVCYKKAIPERPTADPARACGTAFFVALTKSEAHPGHGYVVTAKHVIDAIKRDSGDDIVRLRVNLRDGGYGFLESQRADWHSHPTDPSVDVAVLRLEEDPPIDALYYPLSGAVSPSLIVEHGIGPGDEVFVTGLFTNHYGKERNIPVVRIGNIAAMAEEPVATRWSKDGPMEAYLVEMRSTGGLSGSPVFVQLGRMSEGDSSRLRGGRFHLLGMVHGHYDVPNIDTTEEDAGERDRTNAGIAIIIPASKILEVIDHPDFVAKRQAMDDRYDEQSGRLAVPD
jgi:hypothetical protein